PITCSPTRNTSYGRVRCGAPITRLHADQPDEWRPDRPGGTMTPQELEDVPLVSGDPLEQRKALWRLGAQLAPALEWAEFGVAGGRSTEHLLELLPKDGR